MPDAREELKRSVREWRIKSRHSIMRFEGMGSMSRDLGAEIGVHSLSMVVKVTQMSINVAVAVLLTSIIVESTGYKTTFTLCFS